MKALYDPPRIIKSIFSEYLWYSGKEQVVLTIDDSPNPGTTEIILPLLEKAKIKAAFMCVGNNIKRYPTLAKEIDDAGHTIGNHTFNHAIISRVGKKRRLDEIRACKEVIEEITGQPNYLFRPPHGRFSLNLNKELSAMGMKNLMWSLLTFDYKNDINIVKFAVANFIKKNSVIVIHDSVKSSGIIADAIKYIIDVVNDREFEFGDPKECLK